MLSRPLLVFLLITSSFQVLAQYDNPNKERSRFGSRDGRFEGSILLSYQNGTDESSEGGSSLDIDSVAGWGISFAWNWTSKWNLSYRLLANKPNYLAVIVLEDPTEDPLAVQHKMTKYSHQLNVTYNFMDRAFTPFVLAGLGYTSLDSNIASQPPTVGCWWDPWWGYICTGEWRTFSASEFSYSLGVGLRWDINNAIFTRASYSREFLDLDNGKLNFDIAVLEIGMMF